MDFKELCNSINKIACVISVEKINDSYGDIRIVAGNSKYLESFNSVDEFGNKIEFVENSIYTKYIEKNLNFENYSYRSALKNELLHSYAYPEKIGAWFHMFYIPLQVEDSKLGYCLYVMDINLDFNSEYFSNARSLVASEVLKATIQLNDTTDFKGSVNKVVKDIREMCNADFCCILLYDEIKEKIDVLAEDRDLSSKRLAMDKYINAEFIKIVKSWDDTIGDSNCIIVNDKKGMNFIKEKNPIWYESLINRQIYSLVLFRLKYGNNLLGYMWVSDFKDDDTIKIKETLEITAFILGSEISNYLLLNKLTDLSKIDSLTGLYNKNEMNLYMEKVKKLDKTMGLFFLDVNGFKNINDTLGHVTGDKSIRNAAKVLKKIFPNQLLFRAGGDEFVVILDNITEEELYNYKKIIKDAELKNNLSFAVGYSINNSKNIYKMMKEADERMYIDKREHYNNIK